MMEVVELEVLLVKKCLCVLNLEKYFLSCLDFWSVGQVGES